MKLSEYVRERVDAEVKSLNIVSKVAAAVEELGIGEIDCYVRFDLYGYDWKTSAPTIPTVHIQPMHTPGIAIFMEADPERAYPSPTPENPERMMAPVAPNLRVVKTTPILSQIAKKLLPNIGKLEKGFDDENNRVTLTGVYGGVKFVLEDETPKTCTVERIEEEVDVEEKVIPAHKEKRIKFKLVGDCDPIMADAAAHVETSQGAVAIADLQGKEVPPNESTEDIPF